MTRFTAPIVTALALAIAAPAQAYIAPNGMVVQATGSNSFQVLYRGSSANRDFWCAAGQYVIRRLNRPSNTRIYRTGSSRRGGGEAIQFSLTTEGATSTGLVRIGSSNSVTVAKARQLCEISRRLND